MFDILDPFDLLYYGGYALLGFAVLYALFRQSSQDRKLVQVTWRGICYGRGDSLNDALCAWLRFAHQHLEDAVTLELTFQRGEEVLVYPVYFESVGEAGQWHMTITFDEETHRTLLCSVTG